MKAGKFILFLLLSGASMQCGLKKQISETPNNAFSLDELQRRTFNFFWETVDKNSQVPDRYPTLNFSSIAATGFGLTSYLVGVERGYINRIQAVERVLKTLQVLNELPQGPEISKISGYKGFFYHFLDHNAALRYKNVELSSIDTALLMAGILSCYSYFDQNNEQEKRIRDLADQLYRRVDWQWFTNGNKSGLIKMGWDPEKGFHDRNWDGYNEGMLLYILALGSPTHPVSTTCWNAWCYRYPFKQYMGIDQLNFGPLFGHQYSHIWIDFKGIQDPFMQSKNMDYFENSRRSTLTNRLYCIANPKGFKDYDENIWGLTACDGPGYAVQNFMGKSVEFQGYSARGAATDEAFDDGTIAPTAAGGSIPFAPKECLSSLKSQWEKYGEKLVGKYGFKDAYNPSYTYGNGNENGWFDIDYLGIDQGPILLQAENYRTQLIWKLMRKNPYIITGLKRAGFEGGWLTEIINNKENIATTKQIHEAKNPKLQFSKATFVSHETKSLPYRIYNPKTKNGERYPLVVFLHGSAERGNNNESQLENGIMAFAEREFQTKHPAFIVAPQCPIGQKWSDYQLPDDISRKENPTETGQLVIDLVKKMLMENPGIDPKRVYLTGYSLGAFGALDLLSRHTELFAAVLPVCGTMDKSAAPLIKDTPIWLTHGSLDKVVNIAHSQQLADTLLNLGAPVHFTEYTTLGHNIWQEVYYNTEIQDWLFSQQKK